MTDVHGKTNRNRAEGLTTVRSAFAFGETLARLESAITAHGLLVFARVDHAALATEAGLVLRPAEVVIFGHPRGGTPLMQANQVIGLDLPLKVLVWEDAVGITSLSWNEPEWLAARHGVGALGSVAKLASLMTAVAQQVTGAAADSAGAGHP